MLVSLQLLTMLQVDLLQIINLRLFRCDIEHLFLKQSELVEMLLVINLMIWFKGFSPKNNNALGLPFE